MSCILEKYANTALNSASIARGHSKVEKHKHLEARTFMIYRNCKTLCKYAEFTTKYLINSAQMHHH